MRTFILFATKVTVVQAVTYIAAGLIAYPLFTRQFFEGDNPLLAGFMRLPSEPELWGHVTRWMLPVQLLRGILLAGALYPFLATLQSWSFTKRFLSLASLYIVVGQWCSPVAGSSTIEGWLILLPEFTTPYIILNVIPEGVIQGLAFGAWLSRWLTLRNQIPLSRSEVDQMKNELFDIRAHDGSRQFAALPQAVSWHDVVRLIEDWDEAKLTNFVTDEVTECWIDFQYQGHQFSINNQNGEYWFFVKSPDCSDEILLRVLTHFKSELK